MKFQKLLTLSLFVVILLPAAGEKMRPAAEAQKGRTQEEDVVRITTNLVQIDAVVTDKNGKQVSDLESEDFDIRVDGKLQKITNFSYVSVADKTMTVSDTQKTAPVKNAPPVPPVQLTQKQVRRVIAIVVDDLGLSFRSTADVKIALGKFIEDNLHADDLVAIIETSGSIGALERLTNDKRQLRAAIANIHWNALGNGGIGPVAPIEPEQRHEHHASLTRLPDPQGPATAPPPNLGPSGLSKLTAPGNRPGLSLIGSVTALQYVVEGLRSLPGRKSILLVSDGLPLRPVEARPIRESDSGQFGESISDQLRRLIETANRASVAIYTMNAAGPPVLWPTG